jgi:hypothetical protein
LIQRFAAVALLQHFLITKSEKLKIEKNNKKNNHRSAAVQLLLSIRELVKRIIDNYFSEGINVITTLKPVIGFGFVYVLFDSMRTS